MADHSVKTLLFLTVLVVTVLPLASSFYFLDDALQTSLNLGFNRSVAVALENNAQNLKRLRELDPQRAAQYREQFDANENLRHVYADPQLVRSGVLESLRIYFALGLAGAVAVSLAVAFLLSRRIANAYRATFEELARQREKVRYLQEMASWQELARMLAHEIKNPLTPIEMQVGALARAHATAAPAEFAAQLRQAAIMIGEELDHLKATVNRFSDFARLPVAQLEDIEVGELLRQQLGAIAAGAAFEDVDIDLDVAPAARGCRARIDPTLLRRVLANIVRNGIEANPGRRVRFAVALTRREHMLDLTVSNDGVPVAPEIAPRMFDPYVSGSKAPENMGLGLVIVKKIVLEHGGEIAYHERAGRPTFVITLPELT
jgi:signal transduction histidine kinase